MEVDSNDATADGELVAVMSATEKSLFIFAFALLVAIIAGASVFYNLENAGKVEQKVVAPEKPVEPAQTAPAQPVSTPPEPKDPNLESE
jgi:hypothetical protein